MKVFTTRQCGRFSDDTRQGNRKKPVTLLDPTRALVLLAEDPLSLDRVSFYGDIKYRPGSFRTAPPLKPAIGNLSNNRDLGFLVTELTREEIVDAAYLLGLIPLSQVEEEMTKRRSDG